ncbi:MAG: transposase, partial [Lactobacillus sp.]
MAKLSKQDKIEIFNLWRNYNIRPSELGRRYGINPANIKYLLALIQRHGLAILDQPYTEYSLEFKKQAIIRVLVKHEPAYQVAIDLGLKSNGMLANWLRSYRENGYNVVIKQKGRLPHAQTRSRN